MARHRAESGVGRISLVTGVTGFTGRALARALVARGHRVRGLVRPERGGETSASLEREGIEVVHGDIRSPESVLRAAEGVDLIYHIAAVFRTAGHTPEHYRAVNATGTGNVIRAARRHGVGRTVHCSTAGVHGHVNEIPATEESPLNPGDIYQATKLEGERIAREAFADGLPGVVARPTGIYGPGDLRFLKLFRPIQRGRFLMFGSGETLYHFTYIDDLVEGLLLCGEHPSAEGQVFLLSGEEYVTLNELVRVISAAVGARPPRFRLPYWPLHAGAALCEGVCTAVGLDPPLHRRRAEFFVKDRAFSNAKAKRMLGFSPKVGLRDGVRRTAEWYAREGYLEAPRALTPTG